MAGEGAVPGDASACAAGLIGRHGVRRGVHDEGTGPSHPTAEGVDARRQLLDATQEAPVDQCRSHMSQTSTAAADACTRSIGVSSAQARLAQGVRPQPAPAQLEHERGRMPWPGAAPRDCRPSRRGFGARTRSCQLVPPSIVSAPPAVAFGGACRS